MCIRDRDNTFNATGLEIKSGTSAMKIFATDDYYANSSTIFLLYDGDDYTVYTCLLYTSRCV